jgi:Tol biopolymer transport system component
MDGLDWKRLQGTEGAFGPSFSPDGEWLSFFSPGKLSRASLAGGSPQLICRVTATVNSRSTSSWGERDIVYAGFPAPGLWRCPVAGGQPERLTRPEDEHARPVFYMTPRLIPDRSAVLFASWSAGRPKIEVFSLQSSKRLTLVDAAGGPAYADAGHLLYSGDNEILAVPFDREKLSVHGLPAAVVDGVRTSSLPNSQADYAISESGTLVYLPGRKLQRRLVWVDRGGGVSALSIPPGDYIYPASSPAGDLIAVNVHHKAGRDIWIGDPARGTLSPLTSDGDAFVSLWSPDAKSLVFTSSESGQYNLFRKGLDGSRPKRLTESRHAQRATSWSLDGRLLLFNDIDPTTRLDVWVLPLEGDPRPFPVVKTAANESSATFSPDGKWLAYQSDESGRFEVYVQAYPSGERHQASNQGGTHPSWNSNGRELFYLAGDQMMKLTFGGGPPLRLGKPEVLFRSRLVADSNLDRRYDVAPGGTRFLFAEDLTPDLPGLQLQVVLNFPDEIRRRVAGAR